MKMFLAVAFCLLLVEITAGHALASPPEIDARALAAAKEMIGVCGQRKEFEAYLLKIADTLVATSRDQMPMSDEQRETYSAFLHKDLLDRVGGYSDLIAAGYAEHLSQEDIIAITAFCRTPVGQRLAQAHPTIETDMYDANQAWLRAAMKAAMADAFDKSKQRGRGL